MISPGPAGRLAGLLYFASAVAAGVPLLYVPSALIVDGNPAATASKLLAAENTFLLCIAGELAGAVILLLTAGILYRLLMAAGRAEASLMVAFVAVSVPITFINVLNEFAALALFHGANFLSVIAKPQRDALAMLFLDTHGSGVSVANIFWGLWLLPFGMLVIRSRAMPRILGIWLIADGVALTTVSVTALLLPPYLDLVTKLAVLPELGELWVMLWLMTKGMAIRPAPQPA